MISIMLTHHLRECEQYLEQALDSLHQQTYQDFELHVISSARVSDEILKKISQYEFILHEDVELDSLQKKYEYWWDHLTDNATHIMMMSNDVILSSEVLRGFMSIQSECIQTALSNNEYGYRHFGNIPYPGHDYSFDDIKFNSVVDCNPKETTLIRTAWVPYYAIFMNKSVMDKVGKLDPDFEKKYNDLDFSYRAWKLGIPTVINPWGHAFHYGSKTMATDKTPEQEREIDKAFAMKYTMEELFKFFH